MKIRSEDGLAWQWLCRSQRSVCYFCCCIIWECNTHPAMHGGGSGGSWNPLWLFCGMKLMFLPIQLCWLEESHGRNTKRLKDAAHFILFGSRRREEANFRGGVSSDLLTTKKSQWLRTVGGGNVENFAKGKCLLCEDFSSLRNAVVGTWTICLDWLLFCKFFCSIVKTLSG